MVQVIEKPSNVSDSRSLPLRRRAGNATDTQTHVVNQEKEKPSLFARVRTFLLGEKGVVLLTQLLVMIPALTLFLVLIGDYWGGSRNIPQSVFRATHLVVRATMAGTTFLFFHGLFRLTWTRRILSAAYLTVYGAVILVILNYHNYFGFFPDIRQFLIGGKSTAYQATFLGELVLYLLVDWKNILILASLFLGFVVSLRLGAAAWRWRRYQFAIVTVVGLAMLGLQFARHGTVARGMKHSGPQGTYMAFGLIPTYCGMMNEYLEYVQRPSVPLGAYPGPILEADAGGDVLPSKPSPNGAIPKPVVRLDNPNVFLIQVESLDERLVDMQVAGRPVMPFLAGLKKESHYCSNCLAMHFGGGTSDAELCVNLSLLPLLSHAGLWTAKFDQIVTLPEVLKERGYTTVACHPNSGLFYGRNVFIPRMEYTHFWDANEYEGDASGWYARDERFLVETLAKLEQLDDSSPLLAYLITIQSHDPFRNVLPGAIETWDFSQDSFNVRQKYCIASFHEVDRALQSFFEKLRESRFADNSVVVLYGDHGSNVWNVPGIVKSNKVPLLIWAPGIEPRTDARACSLIDVAPTVLDLLGVDGRSTTWLGSSLLKPGKRFCLFPDRTRITVDAEGEMQVEQACQDPAYTTYLEFSRSALLK